MQNILCFILCCFLLSSNFIFAASLNRNLPKPIEIIYKSSSSSNIPFSAASTPKINPRKIMTLGLVVSIISFVFLPISIPLTFIIGLLGAILGFIGIMKLRKIGEKKWGKGIAAIIIGGLPWVLLLLLFYVFTIAFQLLEPIFL